MPDRKALIPAGRLTRLSRLGLAVLAAGLCLLLASQGLIDRQLQSAMVFGADRDASRAAAYGHLLGAVDPMMVKYGHALRHSRFRYGLFGSSRILAVSHQHLGLREDEVFNFAIGGTSLRQSAALLQALHDVGKAPETAIISLDNHDIRYFRQIEWPTVWSAPGYHLQYIRDEIFDGVPARVVMRAAAEAGLVSLQSMITGFNIERLLRVLHFLAPPPAMSDGLYRPDGSRLRAVDEPSEGQPVFRSFVPVWPSMAAGMKADMARLQRLAAAGIRIVIYESPILPQLAVTVDAQRDAATAQLRAAMTEDCRRHGLICLPAPQLPGTPDHPWESCCHAPPPLLGHYIAGLLQEGS